MSDEWFNIEYDEIRKEQAETEYVVSIFEHDEINEKEDEEDTTEDL